MAVCLVLNPATIKSVHNCILVTLHRALLFPLGPRGSGCYYMDISDPCLTASPLYILQSSHCCSHFMYVFPHIGSQDGDQKLKAMEGVVPNTVLAGKLLFGYRPWEQNALTISFLLLDPLLAQLTCGLTVKRRKIDLYVQTR